jgi:NAD+ kinase
MDSIEDNGNGNRLGVMVTLRMRLECAIVRRGKDRPEQVYEVLNEVVLDRGSNSFLTNIECYISGRMITRVQADGIMLATPTGSTAYSVAAGGSMVHPNVPAILLTPICPHSLNFRPVVLPDYVELELRVPDCARVGAWVCFDGKRRQELHRGDRVFVKMSENPVPTINKEDLTGDWFESLDRCFRWSNRLEQKHLAVEYLEQKSATFPGPGQPVDLGSDGVLEPSTPPAAVAARNGGSEGNGMAEVVNVKMKTITAGAAAASGVAQD